MPQYMRLGTPTLSMLKTSHEEIHPNSLNEKDFNILIRKTPFERDSKNRLSRSVNKDPIKQENPLTKPDSCPTSPSSKQPKITGILKKGVRRKYVNSQTEKASELLYKSDLTYERKYEKLALEYLFPDYNVESDDPLVNDKLTTMLEQIQSIVKENNISDDLVMVKQGQSVVFNISLALYLIGKAIHSAQMSMEKNDMSY